MTRLNALKTKIQRQEIKDRITNQIEEKKYNNQLYPASFDNTSPTRLPVNFSILFYPERF